MNKLTRFLIKWDVKWSTESTLFGFEMEKTIQGFLFMKKIIFCKIQSRTMHLIIIEITSQKNETFPMLKRVFLCFREMKHNEFSNQVDDRNHRRRKRLETTKKTGIVSFQTLKLNHSFTFCNVQSFFFKFQYRFVFYYVL